MSEVKNEGLEPVAWVGVIEDCASLFVTEPQLWKAIPLYAAPVQQVSVPDERIIPTSAELIQWAWEEEPEETRFQEGYNAAKRWVKMQIEAGIAAPAAAAADAGLVDPAAWLWVWLMTYCKSRGLAPATQDHLFESVSDMRAALAAHSAKGVV